MRIACSTESEWASRKLAGQSPCSQQSLPCSSVPRSRPRYLLLVRTPPGAIFKLTSIHGVKVIHQCKGIHPLLVRPRFEDQVDLLRHLRRVLASSHRRSHRFTRGDRCARNDHAIWRRVAGHLRRASALHLRWRFRAWSSHGKRRQPQRRSLVRDGCIRLIPLDRGHLTLGRARNCSRFTSVGRQIRSTPAVSVRTSSNIRRRDHRAHDVGASSPRSRRCALP